MQKSLRDETVGEGWGAAENRQGEQIWKQGRPRGTRDSGQHARVTTEETAEGAPGSPRAIRTERPRTRSTKKPTSGQVSRQKMQAARRAGASDRLPTDFSSAALDPKGPGVSRSVTNPNGQPSPRLFVFNVRTPIAKPRTVTCDEAGGSESVERGPAGLGVLPTFLG